MLRFVICVVSALCTCVASNHLVLQWYLNCANDSEERLQMMMMMMMTKTKTSSLPSSHHSDDDDDDDNGVMLQSLSDEPAIVNLLQQQYDIDVNIRSLKSFMVITLDPLDFVHCCMLTGHSNNRSHAIAVLSILL